MSNLGHSGATIEVKNNLVVKKGGTTDLFAQAYLMYVMGMEVCPMVFNVGSGGFIMEKVEEYQIQNTTFHDLFFKMRAKLEQHVWNKPALFHDQYWFNNLKAVHQASWIGEMIAADAMEKCTHDFSLVHGDPTVANVMCRRNPTDIVLIDPVPCRKGIPSMRCVDVGKMLQSAAGWENCLVPGHPKPSADMIEQVLSYELPTNHAACLLWAAINCARVVVRAKRDDVRNWGEAQGRMFIDRVNDALRL